MRDLDLSDATNYMNLSNIFDKVGCPKLLNTHALWSYAFSTYLVQLFSKWFYPTQIKKNKEN